MSDLLEQVTAAVDWSSYYKAYKEVYREVVERRWAIGRATFANQLHHTAIPDCSGTTVGTVRWAAYSQPSSITLAAFLPVFSLGLAREPHRIRANRYLFLVPSEPSLTFQEAFTALAREGGRLDFWSGSVAEVLAWPAETGALQAMNAVFAGSEPLLTRADALALVDQADRPTALAELRRRLLAATIPAVSTVPPAVRRAFLESSFILAAGKLGLSRDAIIALCGDHAGVGACVARDRLSTSRWSRDLLELCTSVLEKAPPKSRTYTVVPGDILSRLVRQFYAQSFDSLWPLIRVLNPQIDDPNLIRVGQKIHFPELGEGFPAMRQP